MSKKKKRVGSKADKENTNGRSCKDRDGTKRAERYVFSIPTFESRKTDPLGSYTGCPVDPDVLPIQDADDL